MGDILIVGWGEGAETFGRRLRQVLVARMPFASVTWRDRAPEDPAGAARSLAARLDALVVVAGPGAAPPAEPMRTFLEALAERLPRVWSVALAGARGPQADVLRLAVHPSISAAGVADDALPLHVADAVCDPLLRSGSRRGPTPAGAEPPPAFGVPDSAGVDALQPPAPPAIETTLGGKDAAGPTEVLLGASAPSAVPPGDEFTARFIATVPQDEARVRAQLADIAAGDAVHLGIKRCRWQRGTAVTVALSGRHLDVSPTPQRFAWDDASVILEFDVAVRPDAPLGRTVLKFDVSIDGIVVAMLRINLEVTGGARDDRPAADRAVAARTAFASYSSKDRARVLDRVAAVRIAAGLDVFLDCLSLNPGEAWKPRLAQEIRGRDLFLLFWSPDSAQSQWVEWEWRTALREKGEAGMQLHPLVTGVMPPEELKHLHFGDVYMLVREAGEAKKPPPAG